MQKTKLLSTSEVSGLCKVAKTTVQSWFDTGQLKAVASIKGGQEQQVEVQELLCFLQQEAMPIPEELAQYDFPILILDDDISFARAIQRICKLNGFSSKTTTDGFLASSLLLTTRPKLLILDLQMPGINGFDIIEYIRTDLARADLKILVISAMPYSHMNQALVLGADMAISKPFRQPELLEAISQLTPDAQQSA